MLEGGLVSRWSVLLLTALAFQIGVAWQFPILGVIGNALLLLAMCAAVEGGADRGAIMGFVCGLGLDLARGFGSLGLSSLAYVIVAAGIGMAMVQVLQMHKALAMLVVAGGSGVATLLYAVLGQFAGERTLSHDRLWTIVLVTMLVNGLLSPLVLKACHWAERREDPRVLGSIDV